MQEKVFKILEFDKLKLNVSEYAFTDSAKEAIINSEPYQNKRLLKEKLEEIHQANLIINQKGNVPLAGFEPSKEYIIHAKKGGVIRNSALIKISQAVKYANQVKKYIENKTNTNIQINLLEDMAYEITDISYLSRDIDRAIISEDEISDDASLELRDIRRKIKSVNSSIKDKLYSSIRGESEKYMQDSLITMRNGRYVVPVKSEHKNSVEGIVHDTSQSGLTLFVEPQAVVNLNNELKQLEIAEAREIERILAELSERVMQNSDELIINENILVRLDEIFAKANFAYANEHTCPIIDDDEIIDLKKARHPLIDRKKVVASDITIGEGYTQIVITGPNTGGKTVSIKTLGLCSLMAQSGFFIPANEGSKVCMLENIFADIGDEQSIAQSLSTFSSHMVNIVDIISKTGKGTLVLLDELGAGTDPAEGAALAKAVLKHIKDSGALCVATTHYNEIKQYALTEDGVVNASVEFDTVNLKPTYKLSIGLPGKSNAFEISRRLGLSDEIIESALSDMQTGDVRFEDMIANLQQKLSETQKLNDEARMLKAESERIKNELEDELTRFRQTKDKTYADMITSARKVLNEAKETAKLVISEAEKAVANSGKLYEAKNEISTFINSENEKLSNMMPKSAAYEKKGMKKDKAHVFEKNEEVFIASLNASGVILDIKKDSALVQVGAIKTKFPLSSLSAAAPKKSPVYSYTGMKSAVVSSKLDIRGITASEVAIEVEKFLDDASLAGLKTVTIVHGKGEGILRKAVADVLKNNPLVEDFRIGALNEGSTGATIVHLV